MYIHKTHLGEPPADVRPTSAGRLPEAEWQNFERSAAAIRGRKKPFANRIRETPLAARCLMPAGFCVVLLVPAKLLALLAPAFQLSALVPLAKLRPAGPCVLPSLNAFPKCPLCVVAGVVLLLFFPAGPSCEQSDWLPPHRQVHLLP